MPPSRERDKLVNALFALGAIDFAWANNQQTLPIKFLQVVLGRQLRFTIRATARRRATRTDVDKSPATMRTHIFRQPHRAPMIDVPIILAVVGMSDTREMNRHINVG